MRKIYAVEKVPGGQETGGMISRIYRYLIGM